MKCKIEITMDNAAFENCPAEELSRILRETAEKVLKRYVYGELDIADASLALRDLNGNTVGRLVSTREGK